MRTNNWQMFHVKFQKQLGNQKGGMAALLSVIVLSMVIVTSLSSVYIYLENRAKFQGRLKMSYQMTYVMEEIARIASQGYDLAFQEAGGAPTNTDLVNNTITCPGMVEIVQGASPNAVVLCVPSENIVDGYSGICINNPSIQAEPLCTGGREEVISFPPPPEDASISHLDKWYAKLDQFFDTTIIQGTPTAQRMAWNFLEADFQPPTYLGWLLPQTAYAGDEWANYHQVDETQVKIETEAPGEVKTEIVSVEEPQIQTAVLEKTPLEKPDVKTETQLEVQVETPMETQVEAEPSTTVVRSPSYLDVLRDYYDRYIGSPEPTREVIGEGEVTNDVLIVENPTEQPGVSVEPQVETQTEPQTEVQVVTQPGTTTTQTGSQQQPNPVIDDGSNFVGLPPSYIDNITIGGGPSIGGGSIETNPCIGRTPPPSCSVNTAICSPGQQCQTPPPTPSGFGTSVDITTNPCTEVDGHVVADDTSEGRSCFRCVGGTGVGANPCFTLSLGNPINPSAPYRMSVRLIR